MKIKNPSKKLWKKTLSEKNDEGESLLGIIRNIVNEEFEVHESNIKELINSSVKKINDGLGKLSSEIVDLTASLKFMQKEKLVRNYSR